MGDCKKYREQPVRGVKALVVNSALLAALLDVTSVWRSKDSHTHLTFFRFDLKGLI